MRPVPFPAPSDAVLLTDGGLETSLIYDHGVDLPSFAAFPLLDTEEGRAVLERYFRPYLEVARRHATGFVFETPTWRASRDWGRTVGYDEANLERVNRSAIAWIRTLADGSQLEGPRVISGNIGPRGDGYVLGDAMSTGEAEAYHRPQVEAFAAAGADVVTALTMTSADEAAGVARAAVGAGIPAVISFTVETDGRLPSGESLGDAIGRVDDAAPGAVAHYMLNCAHPTHFDDVLAGDQPWLARLGGLRSNASAKSHAELDAATELDSGDPGDLAVRYARLRRALPSLRVLGGCCGTDHRHVAAIGASVLGS